MHFLAGKTEGAEHTGCWMPFVTVTYVGMVVE